MNNGCQSVLDSQRSQRIAFRDGLDADSLVYKIHCRVPAFRSVVSFHVFEITGRVLPHVVVQTVEKIVKTDVVKDYDSGMKSTYFPDRSMEQMVVPQVVEGNVSAIHYRPVNLRSTELLDGTMSLNGRIPFTLVSPDSDLRMIA